MLPKNIFLNSNKAVSLFLTAFIYNIILTVNNILGDQMRIKIIFSNLFRRPLRAILPILSIAIGIIAVISITEASKIAKMTVKNELNSLGMDGVSLTCYSQDGKVYLNETDLKAVKENPKIKCATPTVIEFGGYKNLEFNGSALIWGIDKDCDSIIDMQIKYGRGFLQENFENCSKECLVSVKFANDLYGNFERCLGKKIKLTVRHEEFDFTIVGIVEHKSGIMENIAVDYLPQMIYMPYKTMQTCIGSDKLTQISVKFNDNEGRESIKEIVDDLNETKHTNLVTYTDLSDQQAELYGIFNTVSTILIIIAGISLIVAGMSVMTTMLSTVTERKRDIGIKKAIGATYFDIFFEYLTEAVIIGIVGAMFGICIVAVTFTVLNLKFGFELTVTGGIFVVTLLVSAVIGGIFGILPAISAARKSPIECLSA